MEVATRVCALLGRLTERLQPDLIVIACNTASTIALAHARAVLDVPVVGTVPAIKPAAEASHSRVIGVLGTQATVRQPYVARLSTDHAADCTVLLHGSARLWNWPRRSCEHSRPESTVTGVASQPAIGRAPSRTVSNPAARC